MKRIFQAEQFDLFKPPHGSAIHASTNKPFHSSPTKPHYVIYTDGACHPNPGPGGWCAIVLLGERQIATCSGNAPNTTNNKMELRAIVDALSWLREGDSATLYSDSQYCVNGCTHWIKKWAKRNWKLQTNAPVLNCDLWREIYHLLKTRFVDFKWVRGHNGNRWNEECDRIAVREKNELSLCPTKPKSRSHSKKHLLNHND